MTTLAAVATSAAAAIAVPGFRDTLGLGPARHVVICLIDGLGARLLERHATLAPRLASLAGGSIDAAFPTTTPVGLATLGTGLLPGAHGMVGAAFWLPESDLMLHPLQWGDEPTPVAVQPEPTVFERAARAGVRVVSVSPAAYRGSGLTRAALRGAEYRSAEDIPERVREAVAARAGSDRSLAYVYWGELDRTGHEHGVDSEPWRAALQRADQLVDGLVASAEPGTLVLVTADHGMVDCHTRIAVEDDPMLAAGVHRIGGEPRMRHVYTRPGAAADVAAAWRERLAGQVRVMRRAELVDTGLLGPVDPSLADRIGDVVAVCQGDVLLASRSDVLVSSLVGQHGALTDDEVLIPALVHHGEASASTGLAR